MTDQIPTPTTSRLGGTSSLRILIVGAAGAVLAISAAVAMAASAPPTPSPSALNPASAIGPGPADANGFIGLTAANPDASGDPATGPFDAPGHGAGPFHAISVTAKSGNSLSLKTEDGWTRTITVDSDTKISRAGASITVNDVNVGDTIAFRQTKNSDGSFKITAIVVVLPRLAGEVTAVSGNSVTLKLRDGSTKTITLTDATSYSSGANAATKADVKVGAIITAEGTTSGDSFTALRVVIHPASNGNPKGRGPGGRGMGPLGPGSRAPGSRVPGQQTPGATTAPSSNTNAS